MSLPSPSEVIAFVTALAPGLVILGIRQWFVAAPSPGLEERAISYASVSIVYFALANLVIALAHLPTVNPPIWLQALEYVVVPSLIGALFGVATVRDWSDRIWGRFGFAPVHHVPTAWDYKFSRLESPPFVLVTLSDGSRVGGRFSQGSFASSSNGERDLLLNEVWNAPDKGDWIQVLPPRSILLCGRDIRFIEFF
jgi:hypothetical protein